MCSRVIKKMRITLVVIIFIISLSTCKHQNINATDILNDLLTNYASKLNIILESLALKNHHLKLFKKTFDMYTKYLNITNNNKWEYNNQYRNGLRDKLQIFKRRVMHSIKIFQNRTTSTEPLYSPNQNNELFLISLPNVEDDESNRILYTGLSPTQSNIFDIRYIENYIKLWSDFLDWLFRRTKADEINCKYHFPKIPASENGCKFIVLNELPKFVLIEEKCEYLNSLPSYVLFFFYYISNGLICRLIQTNVRFSVLRIFLYNKETSELPSNLLLCLIGRFYWGVFFIVLIANNIIVILLLISIFLALVCVGCITGRSDRDENKFEFNKFKRDTNITDIEITKDISNRIDKIETNQKKIIDGVSK